MAKLKLPFELEKPSNNEYVTQADQIGYGIGSAADALGKIDDISKSSTASEDNEIRFETDNGTLVGKVNANGADFANLKKNGQNVATENQIPSVPTLDTSISDSPSNSHTPSTKAVKDYVDEHGGGTGDLPISSETTLSEDNVITFETDNGTLVGTIAATGADFVNLKKGGKAVATEEYVDEHGGGGGNFPIEEEDNFDKNGIEVKDGNDTVVKVTSNGLQAKQYYRVDGTLIERKPLRFALVTDIHYAIYVGAAHEDRVRDGVTDDQRMQMWVDLVKDEMKNKNIDFILCTGDVVQGWYIPESRVRLYNTFLSQLGLNFFAIDGNHDLGSNNPNYLQAFYNDKYFSFTCKDYYFICPDMYSHCIQPSGGWTDSFNDYIYRKENGTLVSTGITHLEWMTAEANKAHALGKEIIIALHWYRRYNETTTSEATDADGTTIPIGTSMPSEVDMFTSWCHTHGVKYVLIGHQHSVECRQVKGIWHICAGWFAYRSDNYTMTTPWGIGIVEFANGVDKYTQITPEHVYSSRFDGDTVVIQPNNHPLYSRVEYTLNSNNILPTADMDVQSHSNFTNCLTNQNN